MAKKPTINCTRCGHTRTGSHASWCKDCFNAYRRDRRKRQREHIRRGAQGYNAPTRSEAHHHRLSRKPKRHGLRTADKTITLELTVELHSLLLELTTLGLFGDSPTKVALSLLRQTAQREADAWHATAALVPHTPELVG